MKLLVAFRRAHPVLRRRDFLRGAGSAASSRPDVSWHGPELFAPDWAAGRSFLMHLAGEHAPTPDCDVALALNMGEEPAELAVPQPPRGQRWLRVVDTSRESPDDIRDEGREEPLAPGPLLAVPPRTAILLRSR